MAGIKWVVESDEISSGTSKVTILQVASPSGYRQAIREWSCSLNAPAGSPPCLVQVYRQSPAVSADGGTPVTIKKWNTQDGLSSHVTAEENFDVSTQPTDDDELFGEEVASVGGGYTWQAPEGGEIILNPGEALGIVITATVATKVK